MSQSRERVRTRCIRATTNIFFVLICFAVTPIAAAASSVGWLSDLPEGVEMHRTKAGIADDSGWYLAQSTEGMFQVKLPFLFEDWSVDIQGLGVRSNSVGGRSSDNVSISVTEFPRVALAIPSDMKALMKEVAEGMTVSKLRYFNYKGLKSSQFRVEEGRFVRVYRYLLGKEHLYQFSLEYPLKKQKWVHRNIEPFLFNSFRVVKKSEDN